ncbi:hypothetical protein BOTBODRAFT_144906 [Botryobasidium botryosum FD-172 SS1]|uniref:methionine--tRNA ligase n=1 Tax=Botryobasidium botryosum (strain FD-172 SS1) TaxID=930990 RepID=A0A067MWH9_BOTB1|nr:hypothetical protein BOTBODRAFT_144906 [Botryobasidium botryosum FD-172 SS1]
MAQNIREEADLLMNIPKEGEKILPQTGKKNILITSALPYCNNVPHLGNIIGSTLSADVFARYNRSRNNQTLYICGTDEYGTATETQALKEGLAPRALCDKYRELHRESYSWFEMAFDLFGQTSTEKHTEICQDIYLQLYKNDMLEKQTKEQTYCETCSKFLADRFVEGICPHCGYEDARGDQCDGCSRTLDPVELIKPRCHLSREHTVVTKTSAHMYMRLNTIQPQIEAWMKKTWKEGRWAPNSVINADGEIIDARLKGGLRPNPVTRDLTWGVPLPHTGDPIDEEMKGKVMYVWFDAPIGYPSITANYTDEWRQWWFNPEDVKLYQFMGKDNAYFHTIMFPGTLLGDGRKWTMLHHVSTTEFLQYESGKFSKSRNIGVFGPAAKQTGVPASVWRYYLLSTRPENSDSTFSWNEFIAANNSVLLNNFGNFVNRVLKFISAKYDGVVPDANDASGLIPTENNGDEHDPTFVNEINDLLKDYINAMESVKLRLGIQTVMAISARGNAYLQRSGLGNALFSDSPQQCARVLLRAVNLIYALSALTFPFMPSTSTEILAQLNAPARTVPERLSVDILPGHILGSPAHLFKRIDEKMADVWRAMFGGGATEQPKEAAVSKRKAAAAAKKAGVKNVIADENAVKTVEMVELEKKIAAQGDLVRGIKSGTVQGQSLDEALAELLKLKASLSGLASAVTQ